MSCESNNHTTVICVLFVIVCSFRIQKNPKSAHRIKCAYCIDLCYCYFQNSLALTFFCCASVYEHRGCKHMIISELVPSETASLSCIMVVHYRSTAWNSKSHYCKVKIKNTVKSASSMQ